jgi:hypothetical protein
MNTILTVFALLVVGIIVANALKGRGGAPAGAVVPVPPMGMLNVNGGWSTPVDADQAVKAGCRLVDVVTSGYAYRKVEPARNVTIGAVNAAIVGREKDGVRRLRGSARGEVINIGP